MSSFWPASAATGAPPTKNMSSMQVAAPMRWSDIVAVRKSTHPEAAPIKRILDTTELCERVLAYVPPQNLIHLQGVCRTFRAIIKGSQLLQRVLFLIPEAAKGANAEWVLGDDNDLLAGARAQRYLDNTKNFAVIPPSALPYVYNPMLFASNESLSLSSRFKMELRDPNSSSTMSLTRGSCAYISTDTTESSCHAMFLTQPPVRKATVRIIGRCYYPEWEDRRGLPKWDYGCVKLLEVIDASGVTFGGLLDEFKLDGSGFSDGFGGIGLPGVFVLSREDKERVEADAEAMASVEADVEEKKSAEG